MFNNIREKIKDMLVRSTFIHLHQNPAPDLKNLISLMDRFVDGVPKYDLEWDDFISWENQNSNIETIRTNIGKFENLLFSDKKDDRIAYRNIIIDERNRISSMLGIPPRSHINDYPVHGQ